MLVRTWSFRARLTALGLVAVSGLIVAPLAIGAPQESEQEKVEAERQAVESKKDALVAAERALAEAQRALEAELREAGVHSREAMRAQEEDIRRELELARERVHAVAPQLARVRAFSLLGGSGAENILAHAEELGLTEDQQERLRAADKAGRRERIERDARIEVAELDLEDLTQDLESADLGAVEAQMMEIAQLKVQGRIADLRLRQQLHGILTPEQRDQMKEMGGNVFMFHGDGPRFRLRTGPGAELFAPDGNQMFFGHGQLLDPFEWIEDFRFGPNVWEFRLDEDDDDDQDAAAPEAGVMKRRSNSGSAAKVAPGTVTGTRTF